MKAINVTGARTAEHETDPEEPMEQAEKGLPKMFSALQRRFDRLAMRFGRMELHLSQLETRFGGVERRLDRIELRLDDLVKLIVSQTRWYLAGLAAIVVVLTLIEKLLG